MPVPGTNPSSPYSMTYPEPGLATVHVINASVAETESGKKLN